MIDLWTLYGHWLTLPVWIGLMAWYVMANR